MKAIFILAAFSVAIAFSDAIRLGGSSGTLPPPTKQPPMANLPRESGSNKRLPTPGTDCDVHLCKTEGWCDTFVHCENGTWVEDTCGGDLMWNPNGVGSIHGGNCDVWENLAPEVVEEYRTDPDCVGCFWRANDCSRDYEYQPANGTRKNVLNLSCANGLVFSMAKKTCQLCSTVTDSNNNACCGESTPGTIEIA